MLRTFVRNGKYIDFFHKCVFIQPERTFARHSSGNDNRDENKGTSFLLMEKMKEKLKNAKESIDTMINENDNGSLLWENYKLEIPKTCDVVVIGGGAIGSSIAYALKQRIFKDFSVVVVEKDPTYAHASTTLSVGGLRQQFSLQENIEMSLYGAEFIRNINEHLGIENEPPIDLCFHPYGYLTLASEEGAQILMENSKLQNSLGAKNILLSIEKLKDMFPWLSTNGIELGCLGLEKEGWFDPWSLLCAFKKKALSLGAQFIHAEATGFIQKDVDMDTITHKKLDQLVIKTAEGETKTIQFALAVIAAGAFSGKIARMASVGRGRDLLQTALPVEPRKRFVYCFHCPDGPGLNTPLTIDPTGTYFRRDGLGGNFICGKSPEPHEEPPIEDLTVDYDYFNDKVWPILANRVKGFENLKLKSAWAGYYEYNTFDKNGIIGQHPHHKNLYFATGFSGHGIQQSPAIGRAICELIIDDSFLTINLERFGFERFINMIPVTEVNIF